ncbi:PDZ domain-containing protein 8 [Drosophila sulfurigaster albostrigata]|uniref:PDZ domain-containing protein 8 n=1 Tax=Drosophila sulfurigaster albostrigata TaxID=89887 RepID=UPI002D21A1DC|nr:PDZ domain-containing protein 8 [Drosophila sulfurigaster albostrigata]
MEIPISNILLLCLIFLLIGGVVMILLQYLLFIKFSNLPDESEEQKQMSAMYTLPTNIKQTARNLNTGQNDGTNYEVHHNNVQNSSTLGSFNFVMQFLFHEFKNSNRVRKWFYRKLTIELDELITKTTTGKLLDKLTIRELELGDQFPDIKSLSVHNVQLDEAEQRIENLDLLMDINYIGNFSTSIDADMVLGKKGSIMLKVKQLSGLVRLQFTRKPYTHWSLSFLGDPELNLVVESKYQGRQMQSNITNLISNQIRKAVRRKHTLPNYKLRYKPFFHWTAEPQDEAGGECDIQPNGGLTVRVAELSRLMACPGTSHIYCTITLAPVPFIEAQQKDNRNVLISLDVIIHKAKNQQIGIVFKQSTSQVVKIESILPNTPACKSNLLSGDILVAIEGKQVTTIQQIAKVVKNLQSTVCCLRIERIIPGIIRNDAILEDLEKYDDLCDIPATVSAAAKSDADDATEINTKLLAVQKSRNSSESSLSATPTNSPKKSNIIAKAIKKTMSRESGDAHKSDETPSKSAATLTADDKSTVTGTAGGEKSLDDVNYFYQHSTIDCPFSPLIHMGDLSNFQLDANSRYINVCVFGKCAGESVLLGYNNIQIGQILVECCETTLSQCLKQIILNPANLLPVKSHPLSNQSGFNPNLCFGDILFGFSWNGSPNNESTSKTPGKSLSPVRSQSTTSDKNTDDGNAEAAAAKSTYSDGAATAATTTKAHNFIRTHFHRATQCDFCGKKIWLKDAMQCKDCTMCCHKKCIAKCQNATVCGPVECYAPPTTTQTTVVNKPEFTITQAEYIDLVEPKSSSGAMQPDEASFDGGIEPTQQGNLDVHRASLTEMLAQGIKRQASNLDIPGIVSSLSGNNSPINSKSLPPSPQQSLSRKTSMSEEALKQQLPNQNPFVRVTQHLEALPLECATFSFEQVVLITEPIVKHSRNEDLMNLAKSYSKDLYTEIPPNERVAKINELLTKLKIALDAETEGYTTPQTDGQKLKLKSDSPWKAMASTKNQSEERVQALSIIMLYLCTGLQHAQGVVTQ